MGLESTPRVLITEVGKRVETGFGLRKKGNCEAHGCNERPPPACRHVKS
jgi:hypothetical protein